jgi:hypothetical protein
MRLEIGRKLAVGSTALLLATQVAAVPVVLSQQVKQSQQAQAAVTETIADAAAWIIVEGEKIPVYAEVIGASETPVVASEALTVAEAGLPALAGGPLAFAIGGTLVAAALGVGYVANADAINGYVASQISKGTAFGKALVEKAAEIMATVRKGAKLAIDKLGNLVVGISKKLLDSARDSLPKTRREIDKGGWRMATAQDFADGHYRKSDGYRSSSQWGWIPSVSGSEEPADNRTEWMPFIIFRSRRSSGEFYWDYSTDDIRAGNYEAEKKATSTWLQHGYPLDGGSVVWVPGNLDRFAQTLYFSDMTPAERYRVAQYIAKAHNGLGVMCGTYKGQLEALHWFEKNVPLEQKTDADKQKAQKASEDVNPEPDVDKNLNRVQTAGQLSVPLDLLKMPEYHVTENGTKRVINYSPKTKHWAYTETGKEVDPDAAVKKSQKFVVTAPKKANWSTTTALTDSTGRPFDQMDLEPKLKPTADTSTQADTDNEILTKPEELPQTQADEDENETIHWRKLQGVGVEFKKIFPFCIPFDLADFLTGSFSSLERDKMPTLTIPLTKDHKLKISMPDQLYDYVGFCQKIFLVVFDVSLLYAVYKWFQALK